jgi:hypothetical protein
MTIANEKNYPERQGVRSRIKTYRDFIGLTILVAFFVIFPLLEDTALGNLVIVILVNLFLLSALYSLSDRPRQLILGALLAIPPLLTGWVWYFHPSATAGIALLIASVVFLSYILLLFLRRIIVAPEVTSIEICRAVMVYILIGLIFGMIYMLMEIVSIGAFNIASGSPSLSTLFYFSFTALSTTGFGDINAVSPMARSVVTIEMLVGVMYMAVLIGLLINAFRASRVYKKKPDGQEEE